MFQCITHHLLNPDYLSTNLITELEGILRKTRQKQAKTQNSSKQTKAK